MEDIRAFLSFHKTFVQFLLEGFPILLTHKIRFLREVPHMVIDLEPRPPRMVHQNPTLLKLLLFDESPSRVPIEDGELVP